MSFEVTFVLQDLDADSEEFRVTHIGGKNADGSRWRISQQQAIADIKADRRRFHLSRNGRNLKLVVARSLSGNYFLKTEADGSDPQSLFELAKSA